MRSSRQHGPWAAGAAPALVALAALAAGCGGAGQDAMSDHGGGVAEGAPTFVDRGARGDDAVGAPAAGTPERASGTGFDGEANRPVISTRAVIRRGEIALVTKEMNRARIEVEDLLGRHGGYIASEDTHNDRAGRPERSVLVLRVPEPAFDTMLGELADIGRTQRTDRSSEDVTTQVIDVETRVATQEASIARLQRFLRQATDVDDMIRIESEIASRQAELESLKAQQKYLRDQTSMSTITVHLRTPAAPPRPEPADETGFLAGLSDGWAALKEVLVGAATLAGVLLPFVVAATLVAVPLWLLARALGRSTGRSLVPRRPQPAPAGAPAAAPATTPGPPPGTDG